MVEVQLTKGDRLLIGLIYRSESEDEENNEKLIELNKKKDIRIFYYQDTLIYLILIGDNGIPRVNRQKHWSTIFLDCLSNNFLIQHVYNPTRFRGNDHPNLLDLIIINEEIMVTDIDFQCPLRKSETETTGLNKKWEKLHNNIKGTEDIHS